MTEEREDVLAALCRAAELQEEQDHRHLDERLRQSTEAMAMGGLIESLVLRGKYAGLSHKQMAEALSSAAGEPDEGDLRIGPRVTHQRVQAILRQAEGSASFEVRRFVNDARAHALMAERGISEAEAVEVVYEEEQAEWRAEAVVREARVAELVAFVREHGDGMELHPVRASEVLDRIDRSGWSEAKLTRYVARLLHGRTGGVSDEERQAFARRVVAFAKGER